MANDNPYASPASDAQFPMIDQLNEPVVPASQGRRFINFIVDNVVVRLLTTLVGFALGILIALSGGTEETFDSPGVTVAAFFLSLLTAVSYYIATEAVMGRTIGKLLTGTKVVSEDGRPPTFGQIVGRSFARLIAFEPFSFLGSEAVGWHDTLSKTRVIRS